MKNVIKKTCAVVMMTAVLFTAVAPKPVLAACAHPHPPITVTEVRNSATSSHKVNNQTCNYYTQYTYRVSKCGDCGHVFNEQIIKRVEIHSNSH